MTSFKMRCAVAAVLATASGSVFALAQPTADNTLLSGGATATDRTFFESITDAVDGVCDPAFTIGSPDVAEVFWVGAASTSSPANFFVRCKAKAGLTGITAGTIIGIGKYSGGSETGVSPVAAANYAAIPGSSVTYPDIDNLNGANCAAGVNVTTAGFVNYISYTGCTSVTPDQAPYSSASNPRFGLSDVEPKLFGLSSSGLTVESAVAVGFAPVVSRNFYAALQTAQGLAGARTVYVSPGVDGIAGTVDDVTAAVTCTDAKTTNEACLPSLTMAQVRGLFSKAIPNVTDFRVNGVAMAAPVGGAAIRVCRRGDTSGSQKSFELLYFGQGCRTSGTLSMTFDSTQVDGTGTNCKDVGCAWNDGLFSAANVFQGRGSGDVEACLDDAVTDGKYAVGLLSIDRVPDDANKEFRYVKVDGQAPSLWNMVAGRWSHFTENALLTNTTLGALAQQPIINALKARLRTKTLVDGTHADLGWGARTGGVLIRPTAGANAPSNPPVDIAVNPVNSQVRNNSYLTPGVDNCNPPAFTFGTDSPVAPTTLSAP